MTTTQNNTPFWEDWAAIYGHGNPPKLLRRESAETPAGATIRAETETPTTGAASLQGWGDDLTALIRATQDPTAGKTPTITHNPAQPPAGQDPRPRDHHGLAAYPLNEDGTTFTPATPKVETWGEAARKLAAMVAIILAGLCAAAGAAAIILQLLDH